MKTRLPVVGLFLAISLNAPNGRTDTLDPVDVTVAGQGAIQVRLTSGVVAPCDSGDDAPVFEGWLAPGVYRFLAPRGSVCMQHTSGPWRQGEWSTPVIRFTMEHDGRRRRVHPLRFVISTDRPYA